MFAWLRCLFGRHEWLQRSTYRRICRHCPAVESYFVDEGWVRLK